MKKIILVVAVIAVLLIGAFFVLNNRKSSSSLFTPGDNLAQVPGAPTVSFSASPTTVTLGNPTTLTWSSTNATSCLLDLGPDGNVNVPESGTYLTTPVKSMTYIVKCTGPSGSKNAKTVVTVNPAINPTPTVTISASPSSITSGSTSTLAWSSTDATSCTASGGWSGSKATSGSQSVSPAANTSYVLSCTGAGGSANSSASVAVTQATPAPTVTLSTNPTSINSGSSSTLSWSTTDATSCTASGGWSGSKATSGSQSVSPTVATTYNLTCTGPGGTIQDSASVSINPASTGGLIFHSTLDSLAALTTPLVGDGSGASVNTVPANDFVNAKFSKGVRLNAPAEYIRIPQLSGSYKNVNLVQGTADFWFQPTYNSTQGNLKTRIFATGHWQSPGAFGMGKHNSSNGTDLYLHYFDGNGNMIIDSIDTSNYGWSAGDWVNLRVTWNWQAAPGEKNIHIYFNGVEAQVDGDNGGPALTGPHTGGPESSSNYVFLGNVSSNNSGSITNNAIFDEIRIWDSVVTPSMVP